MSQIGVKKVIGRLISDSSFQAAFKADPNNAIAESGYAVDEHELAALSKIKAQDLKVNLHQVGGKVASIDVSQGVKTL